MKLWIPKLGDSFILEKDWTFRLYGESRNGSLLDAFKFQSSQRYKMSTAQIVMPAGVQLQVDRIYIRAGQEDYNSVTFYINDIPEDAAIRIGLAGLVTAPVDKFVARKQDIFKRKKDGTYYTKRPRFWAKLKDVNTIEYSNPQEK